MKIIVSALLLLLALSQVAEAKKRVPVDQDDAARAAQARPPLDSKATGGITPASGTTATVNQDGYNPIYPPALDLSF